MSALSFELYCVIFPIFGMLLLYVLRVPILSKYIAKLITAVEKLSIAGVTPLTAVSIILSLAFLFDFMQYQDKFSAKKTFPDLSLTLQHEAKRLRLERNIYIHMAGCASCLAVKTITQLLASNPPSAPDSSKAKAD